MNRARFLRCALSAAALLLFSGLAYGLVDDRNITINSTADVTSRREALVNFIWGAGGFPSGTLPSSVALNVPSPVAALTNLERVDTLNLSMEAGQSGVAHHFIPVRKNNRLVVVHHGHACSFDDSPALSDTGSGMQRTINGLLADGYSVLAVYMPHMRPGDCGTVSHDSMFSLPVSAGSPMKFFLEPVAVSLNYLKTRSAADGFPVYQDFHMVGLSGGGWTTTVYAALDPTIKFSFPVAGAIPLYLRSGGSVGDLEQTLAAFYTIAGYPDLFVLGSYGAGRKQVQILNRLDDCCFGQAQHDAAATGLTYDVAMRNVESRVRVALYNLGANGFFRLEIDEAAPRHTISWNAVVNQILSELNGGRRYVGAASAPDAFVRGLNGHLWHNGPGGWVDTGFAMVGVPAVVQGAVNAFDVFYRDPSNRLMRAYSNGAGWASAPMGGVVITDPAAVSWGAGRFDVVAFRGDYRLYHWHWTGGGVSPFAQVSGGAAGLGTPVLVARGTGQLSAFFRGFDRGLYHAPSGASAPWPVEGVGGVMLDFPSAVVAPGGALRAYVRGQSGQLWEASRPAGGAWSWASISALTGGQLLAGSPSASVNGGAVRVYVRSPAANLSNFTLAGGWSYANHGGGITGSPTSTPGGALVRGNSAGLWLFDGTNWHSRGGLFD